MENCESSPSDDATPHSDLAYGLGPHSTRLRLITCSVMSLPSYNGENHLTDRNGRSLEKNDSLVDSALKTSGKKYGQQFTHCGINRDKRTSRYAHQLDENVSASKLKSIRNSGQKKLTYRGVTRHRWTGKYEAHIWDGSQTLEGHAHKGKQVYLGGYETEAEAARAYDLAALKYWGSKASTRLNFPIVSYEKELKDMEIMSREEFVTSLRRKSICSTRGSSVYRGVTRHHDGRWQARIKVASSKKGFYLGKFSTQEEAAKAYDIASIKFRGQNALTNFDPSNYLQEGSKVLELLTQRKRIRRSSEFDSLITTIPESHPQPDESTRRPVIPPILPEHPEVMTTLVPESPQSDQSIRSPITPPIRP